MSRPRNPLVPPRNQMERQPQQQPKHRENLKQRNSPVVKRSKNSAKLSSLRDPIATRLSTDVAPIERLRLKDLLALVHLTSFAYNLKTKLNFFQWTIADCPKYETCEDAEFKCCPNGVTPAKGPKNMGCESDACKSSLFGCCPDGFTEAEGNDEEGCPQPTPEPPTAEETEDGFIKVSCKDSE